MGVFAELAKVLGPVPVDENFIIAVVHLSALTAEQRAAVSRLWCSDCFEPQPWHPARAGVAGLRDDPCKCKEGDDDAI